MQITLAHENLLRGRQAETTVRHHFTPTTMALIRRVENNKMRKWNPGQGW